MGRFRSLGGVSDGQKHDHAHAVRHRQERFDFLFAKGSHHTAAQPFVLCLQHHERAGDPQVDRVTGDSVGHRVFDVGGTQRDDRRRGPYVFLTKRSRLQLGSYLGLRNDDEAPSLTIFGRWRQPAGIDNALQSIVLYRRFGIQAYAAALFDLGQELHREFSLTAQLQRFYPTVRKKPVRIGAIGFLITILLIVSHIMPVSAIPRLARAVGAPETRTLPRSPFSHSFYPDRLYGSIATNDVLVVTGRADLGADPPAWPFATLVVAPRHRLAAALNERIAAAGADHDTVVVLLSLGGRSRWIAAGRRLWSAERLIRSAAAGPIPVDRARVTASLLGFGVPDPELEALLQAGRPAIRLETPDLATAEQALLQLRTRVRSAPPRGGIGFLPLGGWSTVVIVPERTITWAAVLVAVGIAVVAIGYPHAVRVVWRTVRAEAGRLLVMFATLIATLMIANLALRGLLAAIGPRLLPAMMFVAKIALGIVVFGVLVHVIRLRYAAERSFTLAATMLFGVAAVVAAIVHIGLGLVFVVSMTCAIGFGLSRRTALAALWFVGAIVPLTYLSVTLGLQPEPSLTTAVLTPALWREVLTALFVLPVLLLFFRIDARTPRLPLAGALGVAALTFVVVFIAQVVVTLGEPNPLRVRIVEHHPFDGAGRASVVVERISGGPARDVRIDDERLGTVFCDRLPCEHTITAQPPPFTVELDPTHALARYRLGVVVRFASAADALDVRLVSRQVHTVLTSSIPLSGGIAAARRVVELEPGPEPPETVAFELRLDSIPSEPRLELRAEYVIALQPRAVNADESTSIVAEHRASFGTVVGPQQLLP